MAFEPAVLDSPEEAAQGRMDFITFLGNRGTG